MLALRLGQGKSQEAESILGSSFFLLVLLSLSLTLLGYIFTEPLLRLFGAGDEVMPYAAAYLRVVLIGALFNSTANGFGLFVRVDGQSQAYDALFCYRLYSQYHPGPHRHICTGLGHCRRRRCHRVFPDRLRSDGDPLFYPQPPQHHETPGKKPAAPAGKHPKNYGTWVFLLFTAVHGQPFSICVTELSGHLRHHPGRSPATWLQASVGITVSIGLFFLLPAIGVSSAIQPIISYNYGARNYHRVVDTLKTATIFSIAMLTCGWIIILIFAEPLCRIFGSSGSDLAHAAYTMRVYNLLLPLVPFTNVGSGFFQSIGQPKKAVLISLSRQILCLVPMVLILGSIFGQNGVLYALPVADVVSSATALALMLHQCKSLRREAAL